MRKRLLLAGSIGLLAVSLFLWLWQPGLTRKVALADENDGVYITPRDPEGVQEGPVAVEAEGPVISTAETRAQYASERALTLKQHRPEIADFLGIILPPNPSRPGTRDPVLQWFSMPLVATTNGQNFVGLGLQGLDDTTGENHYTPPDTNSATGTGTTPGQVVMNVNLFWGVYNKSNGAVLAGPTELANFYPSTSPCSGAVISGVTWDLSDPVVKFSQLANRWSISYISYEASPTAYANSYFCFAVSTSADATGSFYAYAFDVGNIFSSGTCTASSGCLDDYDKYAVWPQAYFTSWNYFRQSSGSFTGAGACAIPSAAVQSGSSATATCFKTASTTESLLASDLDGGAGVPGSTQQPPNCTATSCTNYYVGALNGSNSFQLWQFNYNATTPTSSTFTENSSLVTVDAYTEAGTTVKQPGTTNELPTLGDRLLFRNAYRYFGNRNRAWESIVVSHSVQTTASCNVGARWYELRTGGASNPVGSGKFAKYQDGTFQPDASCRFMPSVAMDEKGDIAVGYSLSSSTIYPSTAYTGRTPNDPKGVMQGEYVAANGASYEAAGQGSAYDRWGDYSSMEVDPSDDCTMWNTQEYILVPGSGTGTGANEFNWSTQLNSFNFSPNCPADPH